MAAEGKRLLQHLQAPSDRLNRDCRISSVCLVYSSTHADPDEGCTAEGEPRDRLSMAACPSSFYLI